MDESLERETQNLTRSWMRHDEQMLRSYLVAGVEDPRINVQSILARHFLIVAQSEARFKELLDHELRFALVMNWARLMTEEAGGPEDWQAIRHALRSGADNAEGLSLPRFLSSTYAALPVMTGEVIIPNYMDDFLCARLAEPAELGLGVGLLSTFENAWSEALQHESPAGISLLELACGSANDYRFLDAFGLARLIEYTGIDLCEKNITNAKAMFPHADFRVGNALAIDLPDRAVQFCMVQDLFEHLSLEAMERALDEICRVAGQGLCLGFFNLHEGDDHIVQPLEEYHWNRLSLPRLRALLEQRGFESQVVHIDTFSKWRFGCGQTHNPNAYTIFASRSLQ